MPPKTSYQQYVNAGLVAPKLDDESPQELDFLIQTLRSPPPDTSVQKILGYIYHYIPYVKLEHNLRLIISSFLNCPVCFGSVAPPFKENYLIIEVFRLIAEKKLKVSQPTLSIKAFYDILYKECLNFTLYNPLANSWKVLPVISGLFLANDLRDHLYTDVNVVQYKWFFSDWDTNMSLLFEKSFQLSVSSATSSDIANLAIISLALKYEKRREGLSKYLGPLKPGLIVRRLSSLIFGPNEDTGALVYRRFAAISPDDPSVTDFINTNIMQSPVVKHFNKLSFLLEALLQDLPHDTEAFYTIMGVTEEMFLFNKHLNHFIMGNPVLNKETSQHPQSPYFQLLWVLLKGLLFSEVIIFQGILSRFLSAKNHNVGIFGQLFGSARLVSHLEYEYRQICSLIVSSMYYTNFILVSIGLGGFDGYNFIYYLSIEILLRNNYKENFESLTKYLVGNYKELNLHLDALNANYVGRCKVLFVFGLWENYLQQASSKRTTFTDFIYNVTFDIVRNTGIQDKALIEAGHSVLLVYFSNKENTDTNLQKVLQYFQLILEQFPTILSATQVSVAVETLGKKIMSNPVAYDESETFSSSAENFLEFVNFKCATTQPGVLIKKGANRIFTSAQPVTEIEAASTLSQEDDSIKKENNVYKKNKMKKPKDLPGMKLTPTGKSSQEFFSERSEPDTSREAIIMAFLNIVPYLPLSIFITWLDRILQLIKASEPLEAEFLSSKLWKVISENLDLNRCELAYRWWYDTQNAVERDVVAAAARL